MYLCTCSMNLEHNNMTSFSGLIHLNKLKVLIKTTPLDHLRPHSFNQVLCLNHNRIDSLIKQGGGVASSADNTPVLHNLQVLHLAYNGINSLLPLSLARIPSLKALFLQGMFVCLKFLIIKTFTCIYGQGLHVQTCTRNNLRQLQIVDNYVYTCTCILILMTLKGNRKVV